MSGINWVRQAGQGAVGIVRRLGALDNLLRCALERLQAAGGVCTDARGRACFSREVVRVTRARVIRSCGP